MAEPDARLEIYGRPQTLVDIGGGRRMNACVSGDGPVTVVFAPGMGGTAINWARVQRRLESEARLVAYDRAGNGFSDPGPMPRNSVNIVSDVRALLPALGLKPPYILVGHSAGSFDVRLFAFQTPQQVAGLVLVDPSNEQQVQRFAEISPRVLALNDAAQALYRRCAEAADAGTIESFADCLGAPDPALPDIVNAAVLARRSSADYWRAILSENHSFFDGDSPHQLRAARCSLGDMPLIVLTAAKMAWPADAPQETVNRLNATWRGLHAEMAALSTRGEQRLVEAGHAIQIERPDAVVDAIRDVIAWASAGASG